MAGVRNDHIMLGECRLENPLTLRIRDTSVFVIVEDILIFPRKMVSWLVKVVGTIVIHQSIWRFSSPYCNCLRFW